MEEPPLWVAMQYKLMMEAIPVPGEAGAEVADLMIVLVEPAGAILGLVEAKSLV
jgi:hypothetical protein